MFKVNRVFVCPWLLLFSSKCFRDGFWTFSTATCRVHFENNNIRHLWLETSSFALAGGIPCHQWNIYMMVFVFSVEGQNHEKSIKELELFKLPSHVRRMCLCRTYWKITRKAWEHIVNSSEIIFICHRGIDRFALCVVSQHICYSTNWHGRIVISTSTCANASYMTRQQNTAGSF